MNNVGKTLIAGSLTLGSVFVGGTALDNSINPYTDLTDNRLEIKVEQEIEKAGTQEIDIIKEEPVVVFNKWDRQVRLGLEYDGFKASGDRQLFTNRVEWKTAKEEMHAYPTAEGDFEIDIILNEKPTTNIFTFTVHGYEDLDFFYQPERTQEEIDRGVNRPPEVVGSYAVYHKTLKDYRPLLSQAEIEAGFLSTNYSTGKVAHIYRPLVIDADGTEIWGELLYTEGKLSVRVDQTYLDKATYPVRIDPTIGHAVVGGSSLTSDNVAGTPVFIKANSAITGMSFYRSQSTTNTVARGAIYNASANLPTTKLYESDDEVTITTTPGWFSVTMSDTVATDGTYFLASWAEASAGDNLFYFDIIPIAGFQEDNFGTYPTWDSPFPSPTVLNDRFSIYATYSCSAYPCTEVFITPGANVWTLPAGVSTAIVACWGGGGGGGVITDDGGGGGGGGAFASTTLTGLTASSSYTITVGQRGIGDIGLGSGASYWEDGSLLSADMGGGTTGTAKGAAGSSTDSVGTTKFDGGYGGKGDTTDDGGGGGGAAGGPHGAGAIGGDATATTGGTGGTGDATFGGAGGAGGNGGTGGNGGFSINGGGGAGGGDQNTNAGDGGFPGGGGGGDEQSATGNDGAAGMCMVTYTPDTSSIISDFITFE